MKILAILTLAAAALPGHAGTNIGVSIGINAPGQYGRIDINNYPQPVLVMQQPIIYAPAPQAVYQRAVYLYVPPAHRANWGRYCGNYRACGQPVYFVQENWVHDEYRREHEQRQVKRSRQGDERHDRGDDRGHEGGKGNGKGNGKGHGK
jgi:hypothetical protein